MVSGLFYTCQHTSRSYYQYSSFFAYRHPLLLLLAWPQTLALRDSNHLPAIVLSALFLCLVLSTIRVGGYSKYDVVSMAKGTLIYISRRKTYRSIEQKVITTDSVDKTILSPIVCSIVDLREFHSCKRENIFQDYTCRFALPSLLGM